MITDDKKSILERVNFFCVFFIWSDPNLKRSIELRWLLMFSATWWSCARWSRFTFSCLVVQCAVQSSPPTMCEFLCCLQQSNGPPTHRSPHRRLSFAESYSARSFTSPEVSNNHEIDYVVLLSPNALIWALEENTNDLSFLSAFAP